AVARDTNTRLCERRKFRLCTPRIHFDDGEIAGTTAKVRDEHQVMSLRPARKRVRRGFRLRSNSIRLATCECERRLQSSLREFIVRRCAGKFDGATDHER